MADTWMEKSIVLAIKIITDKKIAQASYDRTIRAVVKKITDRTTGEYLLRFQDSDFTAYTTTSLINYKPGNLVYVLIPGNDWTRTKTIISGTQSKSTNYVEPVNAKNTYNISDMNGIIEDTFGKEGYPLRSYKSTLSTIYDRTGSIRLIALDQNRIINGVRKGGGLALSMAVRTALDDSQVGGLYGLVFNLSFTDAVNGSEIIKPYILSSRNVIGNPYALIEYTTVDTFIKDIDIDNFNGIEKVQIYCQGFPNQVEDIRDAKVDIFIKDIQIIGAEGLTDLELEGYSLNINTSQDGDTLKDGVEILNVTAELKVKGKIITKDVKYYWFVLNSMVLRGDKQGRYSSYGGDGWLCVNWKNNNTPVPYTSNNISFISGTSTKLNLKNRKAALQQKTNTIKCVAEYNGLKSVEKLIKLYNMFLQDVRIKSSDVLENGLNRTVYYLDNGNPNLTCLIYDVNGEKITNLTNYSFTWYITKNNGIIELAKQDTNAYTNYIKLKIEKDKINNSLKKVPIVSQPNYLGTKNSIYTNLTNQLVLNKWEKEENTPCFNKNEYLNFPINTIIGSKKILCVVQEKNVYKGTASIALENKQLLAGMYSLVLNNSSQVFQYDDKGNSPTSLQLLRPLTITPLTFGLIDDKGKLIPFLQIKKKGLIKWIIPNDQTLLIPKETVKPNEGIADITILRTSLPLPADKYSVYKNLDSFHFTIKDRYDLKLKYNDIWLHVRFKDMLFNAYSNFTFPKQGDPGTNGTDYVTKIVPNPSGGDRLYLDYRKNTWYDDNGAAVDSLEFLLYNNSEKDSKIINSSTWLILKNSKSNLKVENQKDNQGKITGNCIVKFNTESNKPEDNIEQKVNIVRGHTLKNDLNYYGEYPINTVYFNSSTNPYYRIKIRPKTGFKYVKYSLDGTRPDYDNSLPFLVFVETLVGNYFILDDSSSYTYSWSVSDSALLTIKGSQKEKKCTVIPAEKFDGYKLNAAVICLIKKGNATVGTIHIPIYMYLNRYGHTALNVWDGNSIELGDNNGGTILAPQVGAGKKLDNAFTGVLMGTQKTGTELETGLFGYDRGQRSIFLDANTGNAIFGKQGASQIKIDARSGLGTIESGDYDIINKKGMKIKFSSTLGTENVLGPYIRFGSGNFSVNNKGELTAKGGGSIAGWEITDNTLYKNDVGMNSNKDNSKRDLSDSDNTLSTTNGNMAFWAGNGKGDAKNFYVTHNGYLFSKSGNIAGWNIDKESLSKNKVGMNSNPGSDEMNKAFYAKDNFYVRHDGYLFSKSGNIAGWNITDKALQKEKINGDSIGFGEKEFTVNKNNRLNYGISEVDRNYDGKIQGRIWSQIQGGQKFVVDNEGRVFASSGYIGGWEISNNGLKSSTIRKSDNKEFHVGIQSDGTLTQYDKNNNINWQISSTGHALFKDIEAQKGWIGTKTEGWEINNNTITGKNEGVVLSIDTNYRDPKTKKIKPMGMIKASHGEIGGWTIGASILEGGYITLDSGGSISGGTAWKIDKNGNAVFNQLSGKLTGQLTTTSTGGISGNSGNWKMPGNSAPLWTNGKDEMTPTTIKTFTSLALKKQKHTGKNPWHVVTEFTPLKDVIDFDNKDELSITGVATITGKDSLGGAISITGGDLKVKVKIPKLKKNYSVVKTSRDIGSNGIVTGWGTVTTNQYSVMASPLNDAEYKTEYK